MSKWFSFVRLLSFLVNDFSTRRSLAKRQPMLGEETTEIMNNEIFSTPKNSFFKLSCAIKQDSVFLTETDSFSTLSFVRSFENERKFNYQRYRICWKFPTLQFGKVIDLSVSFLCLIFR